MPLKSFHNCERSKIYEWQWWKLDDEGKLEPIYDKKIKIKNYIVTKNEYERREFFPKFYNRIKEADLIFNTNEQILDANKEGLWKRHPMRLQNVKDGLLISTSLRFK